MADCTSIKHISQIIGEVEKAYIQLYRDYLKQESRLKGTLVNLPASLRKDDGRDIRELVKEMKDNLETLRSTLDMLASDGQQLVTHISKTIDQHLLVRTTGRKKYDSGISVSSEYRASDCSMSINEQDDDIAKTKAEVHQAILGLMTPLEHPILSAQSEDPESMPMGLASSGDQETLSDSTSVSEEDNTKVEGSPAAVATSPAAYEPGPVLNNLSPARVTMTSEVQAHVVFPPEITQAAPERDSTTFAHLSEDMQVLQTQCDNLHPRPPTRRGAAINTDQGVEPMNINRDLQQKDASERNKMQTTPEDCETGDHHRMDELKELQPTDMSSMDELKDLQLTDTSSNPKPPVGDVVATSARGELSDPDEDIPHDDNDTLVNAIGEDRKHTT